MTRLEAVFGAAGVGKSTYLNTLIKQDLSYARRTATTGIAALSMGSIYGTEEPTTINRALNYSTTESLLSKYIQKKTFFPLKNINRKYSNIAVDEISMMNSATLDLIVKAIKDYNTQYNSDLGLIISGDLAQLSPVEGKPIFQAQCWNEFNITNLTEVKRQDNKEFIKALHHIRLGNAEEALDWFVNNIEFLDEPNITFRGSTLFSTNNEVDTFNRRRLQLLKGEPRVYKAELEGIEHCTWKNIPRSLKLKKGCVIQLLYNNFDYGFANGDLAIVEDMWENSIYISLLRKNKSFPLKPRKLEHYSFNSKGYLNRKPDGVLKLLHVKLASATSVHKCLSKNSLVTTNSGLVKLNDVSIGDLINTGQGKYKPILAKVNSGIKNTYNVITKQGYNIIGSADHKLLIFCGKEFTYKEIKNISEGDYLCIDRNIIEINTYKDFNNTLLTDELAWWLGAVVGDGSYKGSKKAINSISFCNQDLTCLNKFKNVLNSFNLKYSYKNKHINPNVITINVCDKYFRNYLLDLGLKRVSKTNKDIPSCMFNSSIKHRGLFLQGLFDTDGHCKINLNYVSISKNLIYNVQILLLSLGIISYIIKEKNAYKLTITPTSFSIFKDLVNFSVPYKKAALENLCKINHSTNIDSIPKDIKQVLLDDLNCKLESTLYKNDIDLYNLLRNKRYNLTYTKFAIVLDFYKKNNFELPTLIKTVLDSNYFFSPVSKINQLESEELIDIEVADDNTFWCNGIVTHNCQGLTLDSLQVNLKGAGKEFIRRQSGMLYTALSRVKTPEGLTIVGTPQDLLYCCYLDPCYKQWIV